MVRWLVFKSSTGGGGGGNFPAGITSGSPADAIVNAAVTGLDTRNFPEVFNGTTWDRIRDANSTTGTTGTGLAGFSVLAFDGTNYNRTTGASPFDGIGNGNINGLDTRSFGFGFNGTTWDRLRTANGVTGTTGTGLLGIGVLAFDGTNYNRLTEGAPADAIVNANIAGLDCRDFQHIFNGTTWDRARAINSAEGTTGTGVPATAIMGFDQTNYRRIFCANSTDTEVNSRMNLSVTARSALYNGSTWDRGRATNASVISAATQPFGALVGFQGEWAQGNAPAANTQATTTKAAGGAGVRHICKTISFSVTAIAAIAGVQINLRDGATGAGTILWTMTVDAPAGNGLVPLSVNVNIFGTANTAMTLESSGAPGATNLVSVSMSGVSTV